MKTRVRIVVALVAVATLGAGATTVAVLARGERHRARLADFRQIPGVGDEGWVEAREVREEGATPRREGETGEDLRRRMVANWVRYGRPGPEARARILEIARREAERWPALLPGAGSQAIAAKPTPGAVLPPPGDYGEQWISIGPTDAAFQYNGSVYNEVDSGRLSGIAVPPGNLSTVYVSTSGGGVWRATDFGSGGATWVPIAETIGNQAIGAMAMDPTNSSVLYVGTGDAFDREGGQILKTSNATASPPTWSAAVALVGADPSTATPHGAKSVRDIRVDPTNASRVFVATDVGLFRSTDGGAHFSLVDLPNGASLLMEATWSIAYLGQSAGSSRWAVTGVRACQPGVLPPIAGLGVEAGYEIPLSDPPVICEGGNPGDVWISADSGATWTSSFEAGALPYQVGRITLAAGTPAADPTLTAVYATASTENEAYGGSQIALWRSTTGAGAFEDASGFTSNSTSDCITSYVGDMQGWYNQTLAVDPRDANHVVIGGMFCGIRTLDGLSAFPTWDNVAHWLPTSGLGDTYDGPLQYVHADWHRALIVQTMTGVRVLVGTDGGLSYADDLFTALPVSIGWRGVNRGLPTHLSYGLASGDPATGNGALVITGMQDNGTRLRATLAAGTTYDQVVGGDGTGTAVSRDNLGHLVLYSGATGGRVQCENALSAADCDDGSPWTDYAVTEASCSDEGDPFITGYVEAAGDARGPVLTFTNRSIYKSGGAQSPSFSTIGSCLVSTEREHLIRSVAAAGGQDGVYGAALSGGRMAVTSNCQGSTPACTWTISSRLGVDLDVSGTLEPGEKILLTSDLAFPPGPTGAPAGDVYVAASEASETEAGTPVPDGVGHLFLTTNRGATWTPIHGNGTSDLPNVPIEVVRYDPTDAANNSILVGTMLGVYRTADRGLTWVRYGSGLPFVEVNDMFVSRSGGIVRISTYGRGIWELNPGAITRATAGNGDYDRDGRIGFFDLAAMAGRLGKTPAASAVPLYDWNLNVSGGAATLDDADLSALVSRFGGQP